MQRIAIVLVSLVSATALGARALPDLVAAPVERPGDDHVLAPGADLGVPGRPVELATGRGAARMVARIRPAASTPAAPAAPELSDGGGCAANRHPLGGNALAALIGLCTIVWVTRRYGRSW